jgi:hypothetical protein
MVAKLSRWENRIEVYNAVVLVQFPREPMAGEWLSTGVQRLLSRFNETGRQFHVNGITMNGQAWTAAGALLGANFLIAPANVLILAPIDGRPGGTTIHQTDKRYCGQA